MNSHTSATQANCCMSLLWFQGANAFGECLVPDGKVLPGELAPASLGDGRGRSVVQVAAGCGVTLRPVLCNSTSGCSGACTCTVDTIMRSFFIHPQLGAHEICPRVQTDRDRSCHYPTTHNTPSPQLIWVQCRAHLLLCAQASRGGVARPGGSWEHAAKQPRRIGGKISYASRFTRAFSWQMLR